MDRTKKLSGIDFSGIKAEQVQKLVEGLYKRYPGEKRDFQLGQTEDRRQADRRENDKVVLLDTRASRSRRQSAGRRHHDEGENHDNKHKVGIDFYI